MTTLEINGTVIEARVADSLLSQMRGHMFKRTEPEHALIFPFDSVKRRGIHMVAVPFPLDALWVADGTVERVERLSPWTGVAMAPADTIIELPIDTVKVAAGDSIEFRDGE